jgi:hypothetical protein
MKTLNATATATLNKMVSMMENGYIKIDNTDSFFMPVTVEEILNNDKYRIVSVAHYYEQNSDLLADPEMIFIYIKAMSSYMPSYFKQDGFLSQEQESVLMRESIIVGIRTKMQADHTIFANTWLRNIKQQQKL